MTVALDQAATDAYYDATTILVPEDGDDLDAAEIQTALQKLSRRVQHSRGAAWGTLAWTGTMAVSGTAAAPVVVLGAIESCPLRDSSNVWRPYYTTGESTLGASNVEGGGSLTADTWYYVYAWSDSAAPTAVKFQISTTPPTDAVLTKVPRLWKRGQDANYRYLGCFRTNSAGNPFPMRAARGRYLYRRGAIATVGGAFGADGLGAVVGAGAVGLTSLDLSARVPPHSRMALLQGHVALLAGGGTGTGALNLYTAADSTSIALAVAARAEGAGAIDENSSAAEIELTDAQLCGYSVTQATATAVGDVDVLGFCE